MTSIQFRRATPSDAHEITQVVNRAYRGVEGGEKTWTSEAHLVGGSRITEAGILEHLGESNAWIEIVLREGKIVGSVYLKAESQHTLYLGMFAVDPTLQGQSIGRRFLNHTETIAREKRFQYIRMTVISLRTELIAYYERRGYAKTGASESFPYNDPDVGVPLVEGLILIELVKALSP